MSGHHRIRSASKINPFVVSSHSVSTMTRQLRRWHIVSTVTVLVLATGSSLLGLFRSGHYRASPGLVEAYQMQDLTILVVGIPVLATGVWYSVQGSPRGRIVLAGWVSIHDLHVGQHCHPNSVQRTVSRLYRAVRALALHTRRWCGIDRRRENPPDTGRTHRRTSVQRSADRHRTRSGGTLAIGRRTAAPQRDDTEPRLFELAYAYEQTTHRRRAPDGFESIA